MPKDEAQKLGAQMEFGAKYPDNVSIYFIGPPDAYFSAEFCGGPHVSNTSELGHVKIIKQGKQGAQVVRIYAQLAPSSSENS
jgi:alanyl-tRNA synthetase